MKKLLGDAKIWLPTVFTLLQEVDYLFNYLEHEVRVSNGLTGVQHCSESHRISLIRKYFKEISSHYKQNRKHELRRVDSAKLVKKLTSPSRIMTISAVEVRQVLDIFNCFGLGTNMHGHASKFIEENTLDDIKSHWDALLNRGEITAAKVKACCELNRCGDSSVSELICNFR